MPIPPPTAAVPYDTAETAMNMARVRLNDCPLALSGNLLADSQPYAQTFLNLGFRALQEDLAESGDPRCTDEVVMPSLPAVAGIDPSMQVYLSQAEYFNGQEHFFPPVVGVLPSTLIFPLWLRERLGETTQLFTDMHPVDNGFPGGPKTTFNRFWEWRDDKIYMPGAIVPRDVWIRFASYLPDIITVGPVEWWEQPIPILRSADALAYYIAAEFAFSRGSEQAKAVANSFWADGKEAMRRIINRTLKIRQRINHRRKPYSAYRHQGWAWW